MARARTASRELPLSHQRRRRLQLVTMTDAGRLRVIVELMTDPCLWRWEIVDTVSGEIVERSWADGWIAYESRERALATARARHHTLVAARARARRKTA